MLLFWVQVSLVLGLNLVLSRLWEKWAESNTKDLLFSVPSLGPIVLKLLQYSTFHVLAPVLLVWKQISNQVVSRTCMLFGWKYVSVNNNRKLSSQSHRHQLLYLRNQTQPPVPPLPSTGLWMMGTPLTASRSTVRRSCKPAKMREVCKFLSSQRQESFLLWSEEVEM